MESNLRRAHQDKQVKVLYEQMLNLASRLTQMQLEVEAIRDVLSRSSWPTPWKENLFTEVKTDIKSLRDWSNELHMADIRANLPSEEWLIRSRIEAAENNNGA